jgi:osmotically-inducible protein OsmY
VASSEAHVRLPGAKVRLDADIAYRVESALLWTTDVPSDTVQVMVEKGWVTLGGVVNWDYQRQAALEAVRRIEGVAGLTDKIALTPADIPEAVKTEIEAAFQRRAQTFAPHVNVSVQGADVTLSGVVHSWAERNLARHTAWGTAGVCNVIDNIRVVT